MVNFSVPLIIGLLIVGAIVLLPAFNVSDTITRIKKVVR